MNWRSVSSRLASVAVTTVTPFQMGGSVDYGSVREIARFLVGRGIDVIVPCGNTGEFNSLDIDEAKRITSAVLEATAGAAIVVPGVGWSTPVAIDMARHAKDVGATAVMVHHPTHTYINRIGLRRYYERILDEADIGIVLYKRGPDLTDSLITDLVRDPRVVGVKYAVNDLNAFTNLVSRSHVTDTAWICGTAERSAPFFWLAGANGFSSGLANFAPELALSMLNALRAGDYSGAMQVRAKIAAFEDLRQENDSANNVPAVKEAMAGVGLCTRLVREPLCELADADKIRVQDIVQSWALDSPHAAVR